MEEILQPVHSKKANKPKQKKAGLKVDLTPMVDLGFLLIAFFVFTTTIASSTALRLSIPDDKTTDSLNVPAGKALNVILGEDNKVYTYNGNSIINIKNSGDQKNFIRIAVLQKKDELRRHFGSDSDMIVLIKPTVNATYENIVDALDEMLICSVKKYMLAEASKEELASI